MKIPRYEVSWYEVKNYKETLRFFYYTKVFLTRNDAIAFYKEHCYENGKFGFRVVHREPDWYVIVK